VTQIKWDKQSEVTYNDSVYISTYTAAVNGGMLVQTVTYMQFYDKDPFALSTALVFVTA